jgi:hypothetical protein
MLSFFTTRAVTAKDARAACQAATAIVASDWARGPHASSNHGTSPVLMAEEVTEIGWFRRLFNRPKGYAFYFDAADGDRDARM